MKAEAARPDQESFDARARNLFRRATGKHVDYAIKRIRETLEHYAEKADLEIEIMEHDEVEDKIKLGMHDYITVRSYLDDVDTSFCSSIDYAQVTPSPEWHDNCLVFIKVNDQVQGEEHECFSDRIFRKFTTEMKKDEECRIETLAEFWFKVTTELFTHEPVRYTQVLVFKFKNRLPSRHSIKLTGVIDGKQFDEILPYGNTILSNPLRELEPGPIVCDLRFSICKKSPSASAP